ncbi:hypothetical protein EJ02DRAFT_83642 [Clathrospora elynae]|uniref:Uncharacterized protein n=1 Tax=Clathrospora elynae TaxID=706981 RepID=A0A6A5SYX3_9PLEO|nr:hypothetical protein EJ02DRAFT_83642 [Clathrospora elynae]
MRGKATVDIQRPSTSVIWYHYFELREHPKHKLACAQVVVKNEGGGSKLPDGWHPQSAVTRVPLLTQLFHRTCPSPKVTKLAHTWLFRGFCYPRTGAPGETITDDWNSISQACSFRDEMAELRKLDVKRVFRLSTRDTAYQKEVKDRLYLP